MAELTTTEIELEDWSNPASPVVVGATSFVQHPQLWVFEHPDMHAEIGPVTIYEPSDTIKWPSAGFELGGIAFAAGAQNSIDGATPLEQSLLGFKPWGGRWPSYPAKDTFKRTQWTQTGTDAEGNPVYDPVAANAGDYDTTFPPPFKVKLKKNGVNVYTHEMKAFNGKPALPINSPEFSQSWTASEPLVPHFNCAQLLPWQNVQTRLSSRYKKFFAGVEPYAYGPKAGREPYTVNPSIPAYSAYYQPNALQHMYGMPPYPMRQDTDYGDIDTDVQAYDPGPRDPNLFDKSRYRDYEGKQVRMTGWKYQPGSVSGHDWYMGKGGARFDRSAMPSLLAIYASKQDYVRPDGNAPIRDMLDGFSFGYFNHSLHFLRDAKTGATIPKEESDAGQWVLGSGYYGGGPYAALGQPRGPQQTIDMCGVGNGSQTLQTHRDATGRLPFNSYLRDYHHSPAHPAMMAMLLNSPMHAWAEIFHYNMHWLCALDESEATIGQATVFLTRKMSWRWLAYFAQWMVGTQHPKGRTQESIEARFQIELENINDQLRVPAVVNNATDVTSVALRNLGMMPISEHYSSLMSKGGSLGLYTAHVLSLMKRSGMWAKMCARSSKCQQALEFTLAMFDKQVIDYILDTDGRDCAYQVIAQNKPEGYVFSAADVPANWAAQKLVVDQSLPTYPADHVEHWADDPVRTMLNWGTRYDGRPKDQISSQHLQYQYATIRKLDFPEYPHARLDAAIAKFKGYYDAAQAWESTRPGYGGNAFAYLMPSHGALLAAEESSVVIPEGPVSQAQFIGGPFASMPSAISFIPSALQEPPVPTVTSVTISPATATGSATFTAVVNGENAPSQEVTWSTPYGSITSGGVFTEPAKQADEQVFYVRATSVQDPSKYGLALVTIAALPRQPAPAFTPSRKGRGRSRARR